MNLTTKLVLGLGGLGALLLFSRKASAASGVNATITTTGGAVSVTTPPPDSSGGILTGLGVRYFWQGNSPWGSMKLGSFTSTSTIGRAGCFLTCLTMASNALTKANRDPGLANSMVNAANGFDGANMRLPVAAQALGVVANESDRLRAGAGTVAQMVQRIDATLAKGGLAIVNVDKGIPDGTGDHFILVHSKTPQGYAGADPATAKDTFLDVNTLKGTAMWGHTAMPYAAVGVAPVFRA